MDQSSRALPHPAGNLDGLVALMQDKAAIRQELLAAGSSEEIRQILHRIGQSLDGDLAQLDPEQLRDAFRCD